jgi:HlyD family secretion protein
MRTLSRRVWFVLGFAVLLVVVLLYLNSRRPSARVAVVQAKRETFRSSITSNGKVEPIMPYSLRAKFDGFVDRVIAAEGMNVRRGDLLLTIDDRDVRAQLDQARAQLAAQEDDLRAANNGGRADEVAKLSADLKSAEVERNLLQRQQETLTKLAAQNAATSQELERNRAALERAEASLDQAHKAKQQFEHQTELDRERLTLLVQHSKTLVNDLQDKADSTRVVAPANGTLYSFPVHAGDFVHTGDLLAAIADLHELRVRAYIDEPELGQLKPGQTVVVTWDALPGRTWTGKTEILPRQVVALGSRNVGELLCTIENQAMELIPNTTVDVRIEINEIPDALVLPRGAVQIDGARRYVYRLDGGRLHRAEIRVGVSNATQFQVLSGISAGDTLALPGDTPLRNNMAVRVAIPESDDSE